MIFDILWELIDTIILGPIISVIPSQTDITLSLEGVWNGLYFANRFVNVGLLFFMTSTLVTFFLGSRVFWFTVWIWRLLRG